MLTYEGIPISTTIGTEPKVHSARSVKKTVHSVYSVKIKTVY